MPQDKPADNVKNNPKILSKTPIPIDNEKIPIIPKIKARVTDKLIFSYPKNNQPWERWPFDEKFHFILNIAIGGNWGGMKGIDDTAFPTKMEIEHFKVYKKNT